MLFAHKQYEDSIISLLHTSKFCTQARGGFNNRYTCTQARGGFNNRWLAPKQKASSI